jgi:hypothetical protein
MIDFLKLGLFGVIGLVFAAIPETLMYFLYNFIDPTTTLEKIFVFAIFWFGGISLCILFAMLGFALFASLVKTFL